MSTVAIYARKSSESEERQVASIESQIAAAREICTRNQIGEPRVFTEAMSAKEPGRPVFNALMQQVHRGRVSTIVCWKLDRLARNPIDGGAVVWAMDKRRLTSIVTPQSTFTNTSNDKFWMGLEFGMAKKYVDDLSDNVRRGIRQKVQNGWLSARPPLGYLNDRNTKTIVADPARFPLVRKLWDHMLTGNYTAHEVHRIAVDRLGLRARTLRGGDGGPLAVSVIYKLFRNPFYYGLITHEGAVHPGAHPPMVTKAEFDIVQTVLSRTSNRRPKAHVFTYTGMLRCGECGSAITAERKVNRQGHAYTYYHCTKRKPGVPCSQGSIEERELERQIATFLDSITITKELEEWAVAMLQKYRQEETEKHLASTKSLQVRRENIKKELSELLSIRLRGLVTDDEYNSKKRELEDEEVKLREFFGDTDQTFENVLHRTMQVYRFACRAKQIFEKGDLEAKRDILHFTSSNLTLRSKKLHIEPEKPLFFVQRTLQSPDARAFMIEPAHLRESQHQKGRFARGFSQWQTLFKDVRIYYRTHLSPMPSPLRALLADPASPSHPKQSRSPAAPAGQIATVGRTALSPTGPVSWSSSQAVQLTYGGTAAAPDGTGGVGGP